MRHLLFLFSAAIFIAAGFQISAAPPISTAINFREQGNFSQASNVLTSALRAKNLSEEERKQLSFQLDLLGRTRQDYSLTEQVLFKKIEASVADLTRNEFDQWLQEGRFDSRIIDGKKYFVGTSVSNLFFRHPELNPRRRPAKNEAAYHRAVLKNARAIKNAATQQSKPYVLPTKFQCGMTVTAEKNAASAGQTIRAWLPIPREYPFQGKFKLLESSSPVKYLADETSPIRSAYFEQVALKDLPTKFEMSYEYETHGIYFPLQQEKIISSDLQNPELKPFVSEAPHVVFSPKLHAIAKELIGTETNKMLQAKAFYDWIADNIKYSYAREYSTLTNISDYCLRNGYGDCGQEALLFITLCRSQNIPARWQTGWYIFPGNKTIHDWAEIYLAPHGWVPVDPYMGIFAMRYATSLSENKRKEVRDFYFGGLDQYRMIANSDHNQQLQPPKNSFRSDDVDFQRGELESGTNNIYFDKYSYDLEVLKNLPVAREVLR